MLGLKVANIAPLNADRTRPIEANRPEARNASLNSGERYGHGDQGSAQTPAASGTPTTGFT
jgi:hypothetical protein